ncbi:hypothetical protein Q9L58_006236 [Maublancomyces gigas]|uniref:F-box domain-containing protein n=1 Tax=Discina gigas TaxID=1032678 RepID=A0ABR3GG19_9PEZI
MFNLQSLPTEVIMLVGDHLGDRDLAHLGQVNRYFNWIFSSTLMQRAMEDKPPRVAKIPALLWAIDYGHTHLVQKIVSQPSFTANSYRTKDALYDAAVLGNANIISTLIAGGYDVNAKRFADNRSALHISAIHGHAEATKMLLDRGADIYARDDWGLTAFNLAISSPFIIFKSVRPIRPLRNRTPTHFAPLTDAEIKLKHEIELCVVSTLRILIENGAHAELHIPDADDDTPLHYAVNNWAGVNHGRNFDVGTEVLRFLVDQGADIMALNNGDEYPIHMAARADVTNLNALKAFLDMGMSPNQRTPGGKTILAGALQFRPEAFPVVELLLDRGAIASGPDGVNLLHFFSDIYKADNEGHSELFERFMRLFLSYGVDFNGDEAKCFTLSAYTGNVPVMKLIFEKGADINTATHSHYHGLKTPLQIAIRKESTEMVEFLVQRGVRMSLGEKGLVEEFLGRKIGKSTFA